MKQEQSSAAQVQQRSRNLLWIGVIATLTLVLVVMSVIAYGYAAKPGWVGVSGKKVWDYLELLIVPAVLAIGVVLLNWTQREREKAAENAQKEHDLEVENQRAQDTALDAYLDRFAGKLVELRALSRSYETTASDLQEALQEFEEWMEEHSDYFRKDFDDSSRDLKKGGAKRNREEREEEIKKLERAKISYSIALGDTRTLIRTLTLTLLDRGVDESRKRAIMRFLSEFGLLDRGSPMAVELKDATSAAPISPA
jgi:hypothetical protein